MNEYELLQELFDALKNQDFVVGDEASTRDMVKRYQRPPITMHRRVAMQFTIPEYHAVASILKKIDAYLKPAEPVEEEARESA